MKELIDRQAAIDAINSHFGFNIEEEYGSAVQEVLNALPSAQPERKKGKWINIRHDNIAECDQCGITGRAWMNFCFDCGADMRKEANA